MYVGSQQSMTEYHMTQATSVINVLNLTTMWMVKRLEISKPINILVYQN